MESTLIRKFLLSLTCLVVPSYSYAVEVVTMEIPGVLDLNGNGVYDIVIKQETNAKIMCMPNKRAFEYFDKCKSCCMAPLNTSTEFYAYSPKDYIESNPLGIAKVYIFTKPGTPPISDLALLKGKKVGATLGMNYGKTIEKSGIEFEFVSDLELNIKKLQAGRLDAFIEYIPDAYVAFEKLKMEPFPHVKDKPLVVHRDTVLCKKSTETESFVKNLNKFIKPVE